HVIRFARTRRKIRDRKSHLDHRPSRGLIIAALHGGDRATLLMLFRSSAFQANAWRSASSATPVIAMSRNLPRSGSANAASRCARLSIDGLRRRNAGSRSMRTMATCTSFGTTRQPAHGTSPPIERAPADYGRARYASVPAGPNSQCENCHSQTEQRESVRLRNDARRSEIDNCKTIRAAGGAGQATVQRHEDAAEIGLAEDECVEQRLFGGVDAEHETRDAVAGEGAREVLLSIDRADERAGRGEKVERDVRHID